MDYKAYADQMIKTAMRYVSSGMFTNLGKASKGEVFMLDFLMSHGPCRPSDLGSALNFSAARIAVALGILEKKGFITRAMDLCDRRVIRVNLTESGRDAAEKLRIDAFERLERIFEEMGEESTKEFVRSSTKFLEVVHKLKCNGE
jgi:DNA-binding MarR family transcriptional regulator